MVGDVVAPDVGEVELGTPLADVIDLVGSGLLPQRRVKAVFSGVANPVVTGDQVGVPCPTKGSRRSAAGTGTDADVAEIGSWLRKVTDGARCYLATEEPLAVGSILQAFADEIVEHLDGGGCPRPRGLVVPKLVDMGAGQARYDEHQRSKQPDWTYAVATRR